MNIEEESTETRNYKINGEDVPFEFVKGKVNGVPSRKVVGVFSGKNGTILLMMIAAESDYDDEKIVKMIDSIRLPGEASPAAASKPDESTDKKPAETENAESENADSEEADAEEMKDEKEKQPEPASP